MWRLFPGLKSTAPFAEMVGGREVRIVQYQTRNETGWVTLKAWEVPA